MIFNTRGRVDNTIRNSVIGVISQFVNLLSGFAGRTIFIRSLGMEYLGLNGLFSNILTILSLTELGIGNAILYSMYRAVADQDELQISGLMNYYRHIYYLVGIAVGVLGISAVPFLGMIIAGKVTVTNVSEIYLFFLGNTVISYFAAYKRSIFYVDQREYVLKVCAAVFCMIRTGLQIVILLWTGDYVLYLLIQGGCTLLENIAISIYADYVYPFLVHNRKASLGKNTRKKIAMNIRALFIYKAGGAVLGGTDNIIIAAVDGVIDVGLLSNYGMLTGALQTFLTVIGNAVTASVGNYIAREHRDNQKKLITRVSYAYYVMYGCVCVCSVAVLDNVIDIWIGKEHVLPLQIVVIHCVNLYIYGTLCGIWTFRSTMGLFVYGKWRPVVTAILNVFLSVWLGRRMGLAGVLLGTAFSRLLTNAWFDPYVVFRYGLRKSPVQYYLKWMLYLLLVGIDIGLVLLIKRVFPVTAGMGILLYGLSSAAIFLGTVTLFFHKTDEYKYMLRIIRGIMFRKSV